ncbi:MAG TPA: hypothetical protein PKK54_02780 [bacterium]|jgi:hypothetical protein|nr:MAG: hypothetical protein BWX72_00108 [Firmicutes bacterium ADurb.Bin080]HOA18794.1 hypothetical protein [bacterium]HPX24484.1 hypothetical protein [Methanofastidiosum sp.]
MIVVKDNSFMGIIQELLSIHNECDACLNSLLSEYTSIINENLSKKRYRERIDLLCKKYNVSFRINDLERAIEDTKNLRKKALKTMLDPCDIEVLSLKLEDSMETMLFILRAISDSDSNIVIKLF